MQWIKALLADYPEMGVYLALGIGYWVGSLRLGSFSLGGVTGSLLAGMLLGWLFQVPVSATAKSVVFLLFLFAIGYEVGPRFVPAMKGDGWRFAALGVFMPMVGLLAAWTVASQLGLDPGLSAGLLAGGLTESPAIGTASEAINNLPLDAAAREVLVAHVGVAYALCYVCGALGVIFTCTVIGPALLRIDLRHEALALEAAYGITRTRKDVLSAWRPFETRAFRVHGGSRAVGQTVASAERMAGDVRLFIHRLRRGEALLEAAPDTVLQDGDLLAVSGRREAVVGLLGGRGEEVEDAALLDISIASFEVFVGSRGSGRELEGIARSDEARAVFVQRITRDGLEIPVGARTTLERGDIVLLVGPEPDVLRLARHLGVVVRPTDVTDLVVVGFAIFLGALLGVVASVRVGQAAITLSTSVGVLIAGIVTGHLRARRPLFARIPDGAVRLMQNFGLAAFVAMVGLGAGPHFLEALEQAGVGLFLGGIVVTMSPLLAGLWFGRYVLKIQPLLLLGAISGAQTFTAGLAALQEKSESPIAVIGYSGAVAVAHVVLTTWGTVMVLVMS